MIAARARRPGDGDPTACFWQQIDTSGAPPEHRPELGPCWLWRGATTAGGYGYLPGRGSTRHLVYAHRFSWALHHGPIPDGLYVLHACDTPACVNPAHLFLGTQRDNVADRDAKGRTARGDRSGARTHPERLARGERHGRRRHPERFRAHTRLAPEQVRTIRERYAEGGVSQLRLAREYGVTQKAVWKILRGRSWRDLPAPQEGPR